jgi:multidrug efflux pump subunit AcrA (membrane-fusion protein)
VRAPAAGVVLERLVAPGADVGARDAALVTLYDPRSVRVRVDVPQGDVADLFVGQAVRVESDARRGEPYAGEVVRIVRQADINKVTLQAHVRLADPADLLRPEMLVQARFLGRAEAAPGAGAGPDEGRGAGATATARGAAVRIPADVVQDGGRVWVLDPVDGRVRPRDVTLGERLDDGVLVLDGLNLSDKVVASRLDELEPGTRVRVVGERKDP